MSARDDLLLVAKDAELEGKWETAMSLRLQAADREATRDIWWVAVSEAVSSLNLGREQLGVVVVRSIDACSTNDFVEDDVVNVLAYGAEGRGCSGYVSGIVRLKDGRYVAYEQRWAFCTPGFCEEPCEFHKTSHFCATVWFTSAPDVALSCLSEKSREILKWG